jgi:YD repeat-containing protein
MEGRVPPQGTVRVALIVLATATLMLAGVTLGVLSSASAEPTQQTTPKPPGGSPQASDPVGNAKSPVCGDQDGSEPPTPPLQQCGDYTLEPDLRYVVVPGTGSVHVRFDLTFREGFLESKLEAYLLDNADGSVNGVLPGQPGYPAAVSSRVQTVFPLGSTAFTPDVTLSFTGGQIVAFRFRGSFYSFEAANSRDHLLGYAHQTGAWTQLAWDDEWGDLDFQDMVVNVHLSPTPPIAQSTGTCAGEGIHAASGSACLRDPVNTLSGAFTTTVTDLRLPGIGVAFRWTRSYTSLDETVGRLGPGWVDSYGAALSIGGDGDVSLRGEDGQVVEYASQGDGSFVGARGSRSILRAVAGGYELTRTDQVVYRFDSSGRLLSMRDRNDQGVTLSYSGSELQTIADSVGRQIALSYESGLLDRVTLPDGRYVEYGYLSGRLHTVRDARGFTTIYSYDSGGQLERIVDQNDHQVVRNVYDPGTGRILEQYDAFEHRSTFAWDPTTQTATMTDAV